ncbi:MAG: glycosyltransferase, partial [Bacteroidota bacterium]
MRIALLHYSAPPIVGGVEAVMGHHARLMVQDGHQVVIIAGRGGPAGQGIDFDEIPLADSRHPEILAAKAHLDQGRVPESFQGLVERLMEALSTSLRGADCLIAHNVCSLNKNLPLTAALHEISQRSAAPRLILWHHDLAWRTPRYRAELHDGYPWDLLRTAWSSVTQVTISAFRRRELAELFAITEDDIRVVPNGIDAGVFLKLGTQARGLISALRLEEACPLFILPVRITPRKNIELALQVLAELRSRYPQAMLVVTGPLGPHNAANRDYFQKLVLLRHELALEGSAHFLAERSGDYLPDETIHDLYRVADALMLPSREEGFGIPVLEAGLAGIPAFCADIGPLHEVGGPFITYFSLDK